MSIISLDDTIAAVSTPIGEGGIGIVRISGKDALQILDKIFLPKSGGRPSGFKTYTVHYGHVVDRNHPSTSLGTGKPENRNQKIEGRQVVDEVIVTIMREPKSYTREDVVEINCHSGIIPLKKILDLVLRNGARLSEPGEFTKRAFLNGRINITQAEAVLDIIKAKTETGLTRALDNLEGAFSNKVGYIKDKLMEIYSHIEAIINFSEEDLDAITNKNIFKNLKSLDKEISKIISDSNHGRILRQGIKAVICGSPNVGKSSLMNALLKETRSIVTHLPGTTRDTIEESINIRGINLVLIDTAGITETLHPVEKEGIKRSHFYLQKADLALLVLDCSRKLSSNDVDIMKSLNEKEALVIVNKIDLKKALDISKVKKLLPGRKIVYISALNSAGIENLENTIKDSVWKGKVPANNFIMASNDRQLELLRRASLDIQEAVNSFRKKISMDGSSIYVRSAVEALNEITGEAITEEALNRIFAEFCIGK